MRSNLKELPMSRLFLSLALGGLMLVVVAPVVAGNKELVGDQVQKLGEVNEQAVRQIEDLPSHGQVEIKADVQDREGGPVIEILEKKVTPTEVKDEPIDLTGSKGVLPSASKPTNSQESPNDRQAK